MNRGPSVVYDCMIFLQSAARQETEHATLQMVRAERVQLCLSAYVIAEITDVLTRPGVIEKSPALKPDQVSTFLFIPSVPARFLLARDRKDGPYLNLAIEAQAAYLVTWNRRHLTYFMDRNTPEDKDFCQRFPNLKIVDPPTFAAKINAIERI
jgi:predicted nucleic acid-binding protein